MVERHLNISSLPGLAILVGMLFGSADLLDLKFEIILIISSLVQVKKNKPWLGGGKDQKTFYMKMTLLADFLALPKSRNY